MHATTDAIDIHDYSTALRNQLATLANDQRLLPEQRRTLLRYISDGRCGLVKRQERSATRRFSDGRATKVAYTLTRFAAHVQVPFEDVTTGQMQEFILGLEQGTIKKWGRCGTGQPYKPETIRDFKKILRLFYRWVHGVDSAKSQDLTGWFDMRECPPELVTFGFDAAQRMAKAVGLPQGQALVMMLFDGGFRAGELFNVRLRDVEFHPDEAGQLTCVVRIRVSKTKPRTISLPLATEVVRFWVERHPEGGPVGNDGAIKATNPNAPVITWTYRYAMKVLAQIGRSELNQRVYHHRFRHASATFYARYLTAWQLCARYGWSMGSKAVQRYVDASGILAHDTANIIRRSIPVAASGPGPVLTPAQGTGTPGHRAWPGTVTPAGEFGSERR